MIKTIEIQNFKSVQQLTCGRTGETKMLRIQQKPLTIGQTPIRLSEHFLNGSIGGLPKNF